MVYCMLTSDGCGDEMSYHDTIPYESWRCTCRWSIDGLNCSDLDTFLIHWMIVYKKLAMRTGHGDEAHSWDDGGQ